MEGRGLKWSFRRFCHKKRHIRDVDCPWPAKIMNEVRRRPISSPSCLSKAPNSGLSFRTQVPSSISTYTSMRLLIRCMLFLMVLISPAGCAFINFENCLAPNIIQPGVIDDAHPQILQWVPKAVNAKFNVLSPNTLNITVFGNVTGQAKTGNYPPKDDQRWTNPNVTFGKIEDQDADNHRWSTLFTRFNVLSYTAYQAEPARFCESLQQGQCPIAPDFDLK